MQSKLKNKIQRLALTNENGKGQSLELWPETSKKFTLEDNFDAILPSTRRICISAPGPAEESTESGIPGEGSI